MSDLLRFTSPLRIEAAADGQKPARVEILAYGGGLMPIPGYGPLAIDLAGLDISKPAKLLADHDASLKGLVGTGTASVDRGQLFVTGTLTRASAAATQIIAMAADGVSFDASVGVEPLEREFVRAGEKINVNGRTITSPVGGCTLIKRGVLREVSILSIGADSGTSVSIAARLNTQQKDDTNMDDNATTATAPERILATWNGAQFADAGIRGQMEPVFAAALTGKVSEGDFEKELLKAQLRDSQLATIRAARPTAPVTMCSPGRAASGDVIQAALLLHTGHEDIAEKALGAEATQRGRDLGANHVCDVFRAALTQAGQPVPSNRDQMIRAAFSTTSLPGILSNVANKVLLAAYSAFPSIAKQIAKKLSANDFKTQTGYRLGGEMQMEEVGAGGEIRHGVLSEASYTYSVNTFAKMLALTRRDIINDDLGAFDGVSQLLGRGAALALEETFWTLVLANTGTFFGTGNGNYLSGGDSVLASTGLGDAVELMRKQTDQDGKPISVVPTTLVVPPELEVAADALYASIALAMTGTTDATTPSANTFAGKYKPSVTPYLSNSSYSGYSATGWYLFSNPADIPAFGIAYLGGVENPTVQTADTDFNVLGMQWRGWIDFGCCQVDHRGAILNAGA